MIICVGYLLYGSGVRSVRTLSLMILICLSTSGTCLLAEVMFSATPNPLIASVSDANSLSIRNRCE